MRMFIQRSLLVIVMFLGITILPWWVVFILAAIGCFWFQYFFEIIALGILYDIWFHIPGISWYHAAWHTVLGLFIFILSLVIMKLIRKPRLP